MKQKTHYKIKLQILNYYKKSSTDRRCDVIIRDLLLESDHLVAAEQVVEGVVGLTLATHEASHGVGGVLASVLAGLINFANVDLDGGVLLGAEDAVGGGTLTGDVHVHDLEKIDKIIKLKLIKNCQDELFDYFLILVEEFDAI